MLRQPDDLLAGRVKINWFFQLQVSIMVSLFTAAVLNGWNGQQLQCSVQLLSAGYTAQGEVFGKMEVGSRDIDSVIGNVVLCFTAFRNLVQIEGPYMVRTESIIVSKFPDQVTWHGKFN